VSLLALEHVTVAYPEGRAEITALEDVSLEIDPGDFIGIWGIRRSGKSTLLRVGAGWEPPQRGRVIFDGVDVTALSADARTRLLRHRGVALCLGERRPERNRTAIEHVALPLLSRGLSLKEARGPAWRVLDRLDAAACADLPVSRLSRSELWRVALAQALVHDPRVLLVDDPAALMRPAESAALFDLLSQLGSHSELAVVVACEEVAPIRRAHRLMSIDRGRLRSMDEEGQVLKFPEPASRRPGR
jgi:ABC-type methionine transport system ATPase subunit